MYEITYRVIATDKLKRAFVCARSARDAKEVMLNQFMPDTISVISTTKVAQSTVIYPNGRW